MSIFDNKPPLPIVADDGGPSLLQKLKDYGLIILDDQIAINYLSVLNYYYVKGYAKACNYWNKENDCFKNNASIDDIYQIFQLDNEFKSILMYTFCIIEKYLRTSVANYLTLKYNDPELSCDNCFDNTNKFKARKIINDVNIKNYELFYKGTGGEIINHHFQKYQGHFPFWVVVEGITLGGMYSFISYLNGTDKNTIATQYFDMTYKQLRSFILALKWVRNICAHFNTLAGKTNPERLADFPNLGISSQKNNVCIIYSLIKICRFVLLKINQNEWKTIFKKICLLSKNTHGLKYLSSLGFPIDWDKELSE